MNDALEFLIAGASTIGIGTSLFYDPLVCEKINQGIHDYLTEHKLGGLNDLIGTLELPATSNAPNQTEYAKD